MRLGAGFRYDSPSFAAISGDSNQSHLNCLSWVSWSFLISYKAFRLNCVKVGATSVWFADFQYLSTDPSTGEVLCNNLRHGQACMLHQRLPLQHYVVDRTQKLRSTFPDSTVSINDYFWSVPVQTRFPAPCWTLADIDGSIGSWVRPWIPEPASLSFFFHKW